MKLMLGLRGKEERELGGGARGEGERVRGREEEGRERKGGRE